MSGVVSSGSNSEPADLRGSQPPPPDSVRSSGADAVEESAVLADRAREDPEVDDGPDWLFHEVDDLAHRRRELGALSDRLSD